MPSNREIEFKVGRRAQDGTVRISAYLPNVLTLSVTYRGERAASVAMTREQVHELQDALAALEPHVATDAGRGKGWDGEERRHGESEDPGS